MGEVDSRRRKVDEALNQVKGELGSLDEKVDASVENIRRYMDDTNTAVTQRLEERVQHSRDLEMVQQQHAEVHQEIYTQVNEKTNELSSRHSKLESDLRKQDEDFHKEVNDRVDGVERHHANVSKENSKRLNAVDLRISGLQGSCGEHKRDINKQRDELNSLTVKSAAH